MNTDHWTALSAIAAAAGVVVAAAMAYWTTCKAAAAAADSAVTAREVAQIERDRWHRELTPELTFSLLRASAESLKLTIALDGPVGLDHLDRITLTIRDEAGRDHSAKPHYDEAMRAELPSVIWGAARFRPGVDGVTAPGRESVIRGLERGNCVYRQMDNSRPPSWFQDPEDWVDGYWETKLRLHALCEVEGHRPWVVVAEVDNPGLMWSSDGSDEREIPEQYR